MTRRQTITLLVISVVFFVVEQFEYENIYRLTLYSVSTLSSVPLSFYGKFPFWFGDTRFSLIITSIPLAVFLASKILKQSRDSLAISVLTYTIYFICSYIFVCIATGLSIQISNNFHHGKVITANLTDIKINETFLAIIGLTTFLTSLTFLLIRFIIRIKLKIWPEKNHIEKPPGGHFVIFNTAADRSFNWLLRYYH